MLNRLILILVLLGGLAACRQDVPLTASEQKLIGINKIHVAKKIGISFRRTKFTIMNRQLASTIRKQFVTSVRRNLASLNGPHKVDIHINIRNYFWPETLDKKTTSDNIANLATEVTLIDAKTGKIIEGQRLVILKHPDFKPVSFLERTPYILPSDHQYYPMIGLYGRWLKRWLTVQDPYKRDEK